MNNTEYLTGVLVAAAAGQAAIALLNLRLIALLGWKAELARVPLLMREVFHVHAWFISLTLAIFAVLTFRFAGEMARSPEPIYRWLCLGIGIFWAMRWVIQIGYYSSSHWRGQRTRFAVHLILLAAYGGCAATYLYAGLAK